MPSDTAEEGIDFVVGREDLHRSAFVPAPGPETIELKPGEVLLKVDTFAFTANNITYAAFGEAMKYWEFFPAADGWGRVPVWGFADVVGSNHDGVGEGDRFYGYFPMSTYLVVQPDRVTDRGFTDAAAHRTSLPPVYNNYVKTATDPGYEAAYEAQQMLFRPLFTTSFLLDDFLADSDFFGAKSVILSSASSKTALGLALLLHRNRDCEVIGLTSPGNVAFVEGLGCYDKVVTYDKIGTLPADTPVVYVDFAGSAQVRGDVHRHFADSLKYSCAVGGTHWDAGGPAEDLPGPRATLFFAPDHVVRRNKEWGPPEFQARVDAAWRQFIDAANSWIHVVQGRGRADVERVYLETLDGKVKPDEGHVLSMWV